MRKLGLSVLALGLASMTGAAAADPVYGNWTQVSKGVYENVDATGVVTTMALGAEGAGYDREMIADKVAELTTKVASGRALGSDFEELRGWQDALEGFPVEEAAASIEPKTSNSGSLCNGYFAYAFDSHFVVGAGGASAVARLAFGIPAFGPPPILNSITKYNSATVTPQSGWGSPTTSSYTRTTTNPNPVAFASWLHPDYGNVGPITSTRCSASSYSYIQLSSAVCAGGTAFISQSKSYPTCVSAP